MSAELTFGVASAVLALDILAIVLYLRKHHRMIDPF